MANPRQRRKAKSSTHKPVSHSKRAKRFQKKMPAICGPKALQDAWDRSKTLRQNYTAMGLQHDLNPMSSGGPEVSLSSVGLVHTTASFPGIGGGQSEGSVCALPKGFGRIIRDSTGNVVGVELPDDEEGVVKHEPGIDVPVVPTMSALVIWAQDRTETGKAVVRGQLPIYITGHGAAGGGCHLENLAASGSVRERYTSLGERSYLARLVKKHGDDLHRMARDRRLNAEQWTANALRRAIAKAGGYEALAVMDVTG